MNYKKKYKLWLEDDYFNKEIKDELKNIYYNEKEIKERFSKNLFFGTGGIRAIIGAGTNRINIYTIRMITQGFAKFLLDKYKKEKNTEKIKICICYDSRHMSKELAVETALVFNGNGIKTYIFKEEKPTPELSFAIKFLKCKGGVVITASHNNKKYNGYKAYNEDGCQFYYPEDIKLMEYINKIDDFKLIKRLDINKAKTYKLYDFINDNLEEEFLNCILNENINLNSLKQTVKNLKIVYSPLHGTGYKPIYKILKKAGFSKIYVVDKQKLPDGDFPTVEYPNPEHEKSFDLAINLAKNIDGDIVILTDADADRVGIAIKIKKGIYKILNGNVTGTILLEYLLREKSKKGILKENSIVVSSIVSTKIIKEIAKYYNIKHFEVFTGFKYIGEILKKFEKENFYKFLFGFEESGGYLIGTNTKDKDAIVTTLLLCEIASFYREKNLYLSDFLEEIYKKYGYYKELTDSITINSINSKEKFKNFITKLRNENILNKDKLKIEKIIDYKKSVIIDLKNKKKTFINTQKLDILYYILEDNLWFCIRQSGTESKLKIYFGSKDKNKIRNNKKLQKLRNYVNNVIIKEINNKNEAYLVYYIIFISIFNFIIKYTV